MPEFHLPRAEIVIQVIFGSPLQKRLKFRSGDIENLTAAELGRANHSKTLDKLVELGWLSRTEERETITYGRPSKYLYERTPKGHREYQKLKLKLSKFEIHLL